MEDRNQTKKEVSNKEHGHVEVESSSYDEDEIAEIPENHIPGVLMQNLLEAGDVVQYRELFLRKSHTDEARVSMSNPGGGQAVSTFGGENIWGVEDKDGERITHLNPSAFKTSRELKGVLDGLNEEVKV